MNWAFVRREWGAVTFIVTVVVGMVVVPLALFFANQGPGPGHRDAHDHGFQRSQRGSDRDAGSHEQPEPEPELVMEGSA